VHPDLGTIDDVDALVATLGEHDMELALDLAFQCSPDHPWVREHPGWFRHRPDGSIRFAENPPKKYEDIYPIDFETTDWKALWEALLDVVRFWVGHGVRIFRVDNPHTKPFAFWEWLIAAIKGDHPDVLFLAEAFTRPKVMYRLAKLGFDQSYTYFAWRRGGDELREYFEELTTPPVVEFFRSNLWPNTPDILTDQLQTGNPAAFRLRFVLAATLGANYGLYGPAFEQLEHEPREPGSEEYLHSEKYEIRWRDPRAGSAMRELIARVNAIRHAEPALQHDRGLAFHDTDNPVLLAYSKRAPDGSNVVLVVANLDPGFPQSGWTSLDVAELGLAPDAPYVARDLLSGATFPWRGARNFVELRPDRQPAHILRIEPMDTQA
jgi:starch synthase (maltosyl-transferring)